MREAVCVDTPLCWKAQVKVTLGALGFSAHYYQRRSADCESAPSSQSLAEICTRYVSFAEHAQNKL